MGKSLVYKPRPGSTIKVALQEAIDMAKSNDSVIGLNLNDVIMFVTPKTSVHDALIKYHQKLEMKYQVLQGYYSRRK